MRRTRQQFIACCCALIFQLALFASLAHAVEHPFHGENDFCASFINFAKHDVAADAAPADSEITLALAETLSCHTRPVFSRSAIAYYSRAPPAS